MSKDTHIESLLSRHTDLEDELKNAMTSRSTDTLRLSELKRRKLQLKDQINKLQSVH